MRRPIFTASPVLLECKSNLGPKISASLYRYNKNYCQDRDRQVLHNYWRSGVPPVWRYVRVYMEFGSLRLSELRVEKSAVTAAAI